MKTNDYIRTKVDLGPDWPTFADLVSAHSRCRLGKSASHHQVRFETCLGGSILKLHSEIHERKYKPSRSVCFVVTKPKPREIFAANFRDRIVHHLIVSELEKKWEPMFSLLNFACRKGRGTHGALASLKAQLRRLTEGNTRSAFVLHIDIASFFVTIDRPKLCEILLKDLRHPMLRLLVERSYSHDARIGVSLHGSEVLKNQILPEKSWFMRPDHQGLPIGNLTSQFGANVYLTGLDHYIERTLKPQGYLRYMDDFLLIDTNASRLEGMMSPIFDWLETHRNQNFNTQKTIIRPLREGIDFLGFFVKQVFGVRDPLLVLPQRKKCWDFVKSLRNLEYCGIPEPSLSHPLAFKRRGSDSYSILAEINARLGSLKHSKSHQFRKNALERLELNSFHGDEKLREHSLVWDPFFIRKDLTSIGLK
jgi:RNA-directed DNA polymerase